MLMAATSQLATVNGMAVLSHSLATGLAVVAPFAYQASTSQKSGKVIDDRWGAVDSTLDQHRLRPPRLTPLGTRCFQGLPPQSLPNAEHLILGTMMAQASRKQNIPTVWIRHLLSHSVLTHLSQRLRRASRQRTPRYANDTSPGSGRGPPPIGPPAEIV
jgi:hypothetical protein